MGGGDRFVVRCFPSWFHIGSSSYQYRFKNINENLVETLINNFCDEHSINGNKNDSVFFISHDIDRLYGSFFEDGFWALKKMKIGTMLNIIQQKFLKIIIGKILIKL